MDYAEIEDVFVQTGGHFYSSAYSIEAKLKDIRAYVFDWDGVFNDARKGADRSASYSEVDTTGVHLLRFAHFLRHKNLPKIAVFDEHNNELVKAWSKREAVNELYLDATDKAASLKHFCSKHGLEPAQVAYIFDDVRDVPAARMAGLRLLVSRKDSPVFRDYLRDKKLVDYHTANSGEQHAVREICELLMMLLNKHHEVIERISSADAAVKDFEIFSKQVGIEIYAYTDEQFHLTT